MNIAHSIIVTKKADTDELVIYQYISKTFGSLYANNFRKKLTEVFTLMAKQTFIGRPAKQDNSIRVLMMSKQNKIIYKLTESEIIILRILNSKAKLAGDF
jgi:plasmid stabilization system protein ParE